jgi:DNA-binding protein H-NS
MEEQTEVTECKTAVPEAEAQAMNEPMCIASAVLSEAEVESEQTVEELIAARAELDRQIAQKMAVRRGVDLIEFRRLAKLHGFGAEDLTEPVAASRDKTEPARKVAPKYYNPETGDTWTGRGLKPKWLEQALAEGKVLGDFLIPVAEAETEAA